MRIPPPAAGDPAGLSLAAASAQIAQRKLSPVDLLRACLARIEKHDKELNAFITVMGDSALDEAKRAEKEIKSGKPRSPLHGIPIAVKDLIDTAGVRTTAASGVYENRVPTKDAVIVQRLRKAGAIIIGKTNLHEFAFGGSGVISRFGATRNPLDTDHITGGSSSGSAAAVAAYMCCAAIGTDTAGSIRLPASCCGIVGFKPAYGAVSAEGVIPLSTGLDHVGPMARDVNDARLLYSALSGETESPKDHATRVGIAREYFFDELDDEVARSIEDAIKRMRPLVKESRDVKVPIDTDRTVFNYEVWQYHEALVKEHAAQYQSETLRRIQRTEGVTREQYEKKLAELKAMRAAAGDLFREVDLILTPTSPVLPPTFTYLEKQPDQLRPYELIMLRNTRPWNVLGLPTFTLPTSNPMVGLQLAARSNALALVFAMNVEHLLHS